MLELFPGLEPRPGGLSHFFSFFPFTVQLVLRFHPATELLKQEGKQLKSSFTTIDKTL